MGFQFTKPLSPFFGLQHWGRETLHDDYKRHFLPALLAKYSSFFEATTLFQRAAAEIVVFTTFLTFSHEGQRNSLKKRKRRIESGLLTSRLHTWYAHEKKQKWGNNFPSALFWLRKMAWWRKGHLYFFLTALPCSCFLAQRTWVGSRNPDFLKNPHV